MDHPFLSGNARAGTIGGVVLVLLFKINVNDLLTSALLAAVGAATSFGVSVCLKFLMKRIKQK